jgi:aspartate/methionine/tyrosine aminotransferase
MPTEVSLKTRFFTESVIREMTRRALKCGAVNLAQGFPDFAAPQELKQAAKAAIDQEFNQYAVPPTSAMRSPRKSVPTTGFPATPT